MKGGLHEISHRIACGLLALWVLDATAATRIWDGGSAGSGNWTADANREGNAEARVWTVHASMA